MMAAYANAYHLAAHPQMTAATSFDSQQAALNSNFHYNFSQNGMNPAINFPSNFDVSSANEENDSGLGNKSNVSGRKRVASMMDGASSSSGTGNSSSSSGTGTDFSYISATDENSNHALGSAASCEFY